MASSTEKLSDWEVLQRALERSRAEANALAEARTNLPRDVQELFMGRTECVSPGPALNGTGNFITRENDSIDDN